MNIIEQITSGGWCFLCILIGILGVQFVIAFHELGHWAFCKLFGVRTPTFSVGFGPKLFSKKIGDTNFAFSAIPLGGYVEIAGNSEIGQGEQTESHATDEGSYEKKTYVQKMLIMFGGILFNLIFALACFIGLWFTGMPKSRLFYPEFSTPIIEEIIKDSPAEKYGLKVGQEIIQFNSIPIKNTKQLLELIEISPDQKVSLTLREQTPKLLEYKSEVTLGTRPENKNAGTLGAYYKIQAPDKVKSFSEALSRSWSLMVTLISNTYKGLMSAFSQRTTQGMGGPLRLFSDAAEQTQKGASNLFLLLAFISIGLAVLNTFPLPIFDGGQALTLTIEAIIGHKLPDNIKYYIHLATWGLVVTLFLYLTFKDAGYIWTKITGK